MSTGVRVVEVDPDSTGQRVDNFLMKHLKGVPKSRIYRIVRKGEVRVNGGRVKADSRLSAGDQVRIPPVREAEPTEVRVSDPVLQQLYLSVIYEDERLLIINKPAGLAVHGGSGVSYGVIEGFRQLRPDEPNLELAHRLDRDTSGCLILCKKRLYLKKIQAVLQDKSSLQKHYQAIVHGRWPKRKQHVDVPIRKNTLKSGERVCIVAADGKPSLTEFSVNRQNDQLSLLDVRPVTGRTHQIRVHAQYLKHPIVGDPKYGNPGLDAVISPLATPRLMLHAARLVLPPLDKGDKVLTVEAPPCERFMSLMNSI